MYELCIKTPVLVYIYVCECLPFVFVNNEKIESFKDAHLTTISQVRFVGVRFGLSPEIETFIIEKHILKWETYWNKFDFRGT